MSSYTLKVHAIPSQTAYVRASDSTCSTAARVTSFRHSFIRERRLLARAISSCINYGTSRCRTGKMLTLSGDIVYMRDFSHCCGKSSVCLYVRDVEVSWISLRYLCE